MVFYIISLIVFFIVAYLYTTLYKDAETVPENKITYPLIAWIGAFIIGFIPFVNLILAIIAGACLITRIMSEDVYSTSILFKKF